LHRLRKLGFVLVEPGVGRQACGDEGPGRLADVPVIMDNIKLVMDPQQGDLAGMKVLITAGGTREPIDPVRYISNRSSGKMGYALAEAAMARGASVYLVSGPVKLEPPEGARVINVVTANEMYREVMNLYSEVDVVVKAAAVSDYRPKTAAAQKIKKDDGGLVLELEKNIDILMELGKIKKNQILVGFAAETEDLIINARHKLTRKSLDLMVANDITQPGAGFGTDTNIAKLLYKDGSVESLPIMSKLELSDRILDEVVKLRG